MLTYGEWLLTLQGAFLGWADALASLLFLEALDTGMLTYADVC
jgi:hypothetical protein